MKRRFRGPFLPAVETEDSRQLRPRRAPRSGLGVALVAIALVVIADPTATGDAPRSESSRAATAIDVGDAVLAAYTGDAGIVMHAGGCTVACGESTVPTTIAPAGAIDLEGATFGANNAVSQGPGGLTFGKMAFDRLDLVKVLDTSTPALLTRLASGPPIPIITVSFYPRGVMTPQVFLRYTVTDAVITSYKIEDRGDHTETFSLQFSQGKVEYFPAATGSKILKPPAAFCWNTTMNGPC